MIPVRRDVGALSFEVAVQPRSSKAAVEGARGGALSVRLTSPPVDGAANKQCVEVLAKAFRIPKSTVEIVSGASSRRKRIRIDCADPSALESQLVSLIEKTS
ncbi:MAG: DUF167 domain-containing protein [Nitrospinota bacterium]|nr:DUF167 domain-containing protein [Nitrospinota bacterium]MDP7371723.1 DUF167 domain-containing protein [Nitrospinota bacterium]MDP7663459.1 DUF167 domain-containing protein [Nitrospinota bacterium]HJP15067.1 DUF167 domain-containing protein [Nitrospinota bacterium]